MAAAWIFGPAAGIICININTTSPVILTTVSVVTSATFRAEFCRMLAIFTFGEKQGLFCHISDTPRRGVAAAPRFHEGHPPDGGLSFGIGLFSGCTGTTLSLRRPC